MIFLTEPQIHITSALVNEYIDRFNNDENVSSADRAINNLVKEFPENKKLEDILLKFSAINTLYNTNIFDKFKMAKRILELEIDEKLQQGYPNIVAKISTGHRICSAKTGKEKILYSFATKYCSFHNNNDYPIYDNLVEKLLIACRDKGKFSEFANIDLKDYMRFKEIIDEFKKVYKLTAYNSKEFDKFLWMYGKEIFSNNNSSDKE